MSDQNKKTPFLAETEEHKTGRSATPVQTEGAVKRKKREIVLSDNELFEPTGSLWMWLGFLLVPFAVIALVFIQSALDPDEPTAEPPVVVEQAVERPVDSPRDFEVDRRGRRINRR